MRVDHSSSRSLSSQLLQTQSLAPGKPPRLSHSPTMNPDEFTDKSPVDFWLRYWPLICCPIVAFATWKGAPWITLLFAMLALREHRKWRGAYGGLVGFLICFGCIILSAVGALRLLLH